MATTAMGITHKGVLRFHEYEHMIPAEASALLSALCNLEYDTV